MSSRLRWPNRRWLGAARFRDELAYHDFSPVLAGVVVCHNSKPCMRQCHSFLARLRGEVLLPYPPIHKVGVMQPGTVNELEFRLQNLTDSTVTVVGLSTSQACEATTKWHLSTKLPMVIDPGEQKPLAFRAATPFVSEGGTQSVSFVVHIDRPGPRVVLGVEWAETSEVLPAELPQPVPMAKLQIDPEQISENVPSVTIGDPIVTSVSSQEGDSK